MITNNTISTLPNTVTPFDSTSVKPVGQANPDAQASTIRPVEEAPKTERVQKRVRSADVGSEPKETEEPGPQNSAEANPGKEIDNAAGRGTAEPISDEELVQLAQLAARDREVRDHEQAHANVGGDLAGAPSYQYESGPDGKRYAVGGEVPISLKENPNNPEATIANARKVQSAALAPADPSPQDRNIAARAAQVEQQAVRQLAQEATENKGRASDKKQAGTEAEQLKSEKKEAEQEKLELTEQQQKSQAEINRKSLELTQTLVGLDNIGANKTPGQLINSVS